MNIWEVLHTFKEVMKGEKVLWFKKDFENVRDGINHSSGHPEVETHIDVIKKAIENSDEVRIDRDNQKRKCYYAWFSGDRDYPNSHMKAVIEETWYGKLTVVTAYFTQRLVANEQTIWNKN